ncbi:cellulase precursor [Lentisphaera araneosa HTCC2155]|uniref:Cellulase n=1 Tax=Lentisphaera araneosa HTCC2155 TaxID=313628 RepID=A6DI58_9BACT|nr:glycoside hydrolase family 9 protein [Lentisphaera araneosa]EDM28712.1 cellulase precursor [Lentisphaera araneosa HTCC2155]
MSLSKKLNSFLLGLTCTTSYAFAENAKLSEKIRVNQVGYFSGEEKTAAVQAPLSVFKTSERWGPGASFELIKLEQGKEKSVFSGKLMQANYYPFSKEAVRLADFSEVKEQGTYFLKIGNEKSYPFEISQAPYKNLSKSALKMLYYFRCSGEISKENGGKWHRPAGKPDTEVFVHEGAAWSGQKAGTKMSAPGGWFDAGDYNKYSVNSGITTFGLLSLYEALPKVFPDGSMNLPESGNGVPDILDEAWWNVKWFEQMQDPIDGGVYHKLSTMQFAPIDKLPHQHNDKRWMMGKTTSATLNYSATMAVASRIFAKYPKQFPGFAERAIEKSKKAYAWAQKNPWARFEQAKDCQTGKYEDENYSMTDEFTWAATEIFITTGDKSYLKKAGVPQLDLHSPVWTHVHALPYVSLINNSSKVKAHIDMKVVEQRMTEFVDYLIFDAMQATGIAYRMGNKRYEWGSNGFVANQAMLSLMCHKLTGKKKYLNLAISHMDYLLGKNPLNHCFVTSYGSKSSMNVHNRLCMSDGVKEPIPGILVGGPNPWEIIWDLGPEAYSSVLPALSHIDDKQSFSTNESAINWNAPLVFVSGYLDFVLSQDSK